MASFSIRNDVGATVFAILSGLSALFLTAWVFSPGGCANREGEKINPVPIAGNVSKEDLAAANARADEEAARRAQLASDLQTSRSQIEALSASKIELESKLSSLEARLTAALALETEVATLKSKLAAERKACNKAKASLRADLARVQREVDVAKFGDQLKPAGDFPPLELPFLVNNPIDLDEAVRPLFIRLREIDGGPDQMQSIYAELTKDGKTEALHKVPFASGSADVNEAESSKLDELVSETSASSKFLVVGYASVDGDAKSNYELSSKRASAVAAKISTESNLPDDAIQAVYFGQTKRFSASEMPPNRVVEVWRVK